MTAARAELATGLGAFALALVAVVFLLFGPSVSSSSTETVAVAPGSTPAPPVTTTSTHGLIADGIEPVVVVVLSVLAGLAATIGGSSYWHATRGSIRGQSLLLGSSGLLLFLSVLTGLSVGLLFLPSALLGLTATVLSRRARPLAHA